MNKYALLHRPKSTMAYAYDKNTIYLWLQTAKNDIEYVNVIAGDPFEWGRKENSEEFEWKHETASSTPMQKKYSTDLYDYYFISLKPQFKRMKYAFVIKADKKEYLYGCRELYDLTDDDGLKRYNLFNYFNFPFINPEDVLETPNWVRDTVWYQIFPERFCNGNKERNPENTLPWAKPTDKVRNSMRFGGDLEGIISKLDYLKDLGITGIYFNPIFKSPTNHKYDTTDYMQIDPEFGSNELFKTLVDEAHKRGIKVMLDAVFNHCGWFHPFFQDVVKNGKESPYYECFCPRGEPFINFPLKDGIPEYHWDSKEQPPVPNYYTFAFTPFMPKWNTESKKTRDYLLKATKYWIDDYHIDGWRLDVSNEVSHSFWRDFRSAVKSSNKEGLIIGENWDNSTPWIGADQMDAVMNYELLYPMWQFFGFDPTKPKVNALEFSYLINRLFINYQYNTLEVMFNLLDCHDTARMMHVCNGNKELFKMAYIFLFTFTGSPNIYYGDEIGLSGGGDPDNRRCMPWDPKDQDLELKAFFKKIIKERKNHPSWKTVDIKWLLSDPITNLLIYEKDSEYESTYVFMNNSNAERVVPIPDILMKKELINILDENKHIFTQELIMKPYETRVYIEKK